MRSNTSTPSKSQSHTRLKPPAPHAQPPFLPARGTSCNPYIEDFENSNSPPVFTPVKSARPFPDQYSPEKTKAPGPCHGHRGQQVTFPGSGLVKGFSRKLRANSFESYFEEKGIQFNYIYEPKEEQTEKDDRCVL